MLNATSRSGLASNVAAKLKEKGYPNVAIGNAPKEAKSVVTAFAIDKKNGEELEKDFKLDNIEYKN